MQTYAKNSLILFLSVFIFSAQIQAQEKAENLTLNDILVKLTFTSRIGKSTEQINEELIKEIRKRKVNFILEAKNEKEIRDAGGNGLLIKAIRENRREIIETVEKETDSQENPDYITFDEIESKLLSISQDSKSANENYKKLIKEIRKRKVDFVLSKEQSKNLREIGGNDLLFNEIGKNISKRLDDKIKVAQFLYQKYVDNYKGTPEQKGIAIKAAQEFIENFGDNEEFKIQVEYLKKVIPKLEAMINCCEPDRPPKDYREFNQAFKDKNWDDLFKAGASILEREPEFLDVTLVLASVGFENLVERSDRKFLDKTLCYAEKSIKLMNSGVKSDNYGAYEFQYKTENFPDGKANALGWMNYIVGYIKYFQLNEKDDAIRYFQKALDYKSESKNLIFRLKLSPEEKNLLQKSK